MRCNSTSLPAVEADVAAVEEADVEVVEAADVPVAVFPLRAEPHVRVARAVGRVPAVGRAASSSPEFGR